MASQDEVHQKSGDAQDKKSDRQDGSADVGSTELETKELSPAPFSEFDPFRTDRYRALNRETQTFLGELGAEAVGIEGLNEDQLRSLQEDAEERERWQPARQDAFRGIIRLGAAVPPRDKRLL